VTPRKRVFSALSTPAVAGCSALTRGARLLATAGISSW